MTKRLGSAASRGGKGGGVLIKKRQTVVSGGHKGGGGKSTIIFDPDARANYLRGFSERKRDRRAFGLAMQKVKDRKHRLEERADIRKAMQENVEEAEKFKEELLSELVLENANFKDLSGNVNDDKSATEMKKVSEEVDLIQTYEDTQTQFRWGGEVVVRTTTKIPSEDSDKEDNVTMKRKKILADEEQIYAGKVEKYFVKLKAKMPAKKNKDRQLKHKGSHGAANMKGMASSGELKLVQKALARSQSKGISGKGNQPKKGRKRRS